MVTGAVPAMHENGSFTERWSEMETIAAPSFTFNAFLYCFLGAVILGLYGVVSKPLNDTWKGRTALFTALLQGSLALSSFVWAYVAWDKSIIEGLPWYKSMWLAPFATGGGAQIADLPWYQCVWFVALMTGTLNIGIQYCNNLAKSMTDVSIVTPISATTPAIVIFSAWLLSGEMPGLLGKMGIVVLIFGTYLVAVSDYVWDKKNKQTKIGLRDFAAPLLAFFDNNAVKIAYISVFLSIFSLPYDAMTARAANVPFAMGVLFTTCALGTTTLAWKFGEFSRTPKALKKNATTGKIELVTMAEDKSDWWSRLWTRKSTLMFAFAVGAFVIAHIYFGLAYRESFVAYAATLKRLQIPIVAFLAAWLLGERKNLKVRIIGACVVAVGAMLIGFSEADKNQWTMLLDWVSSK